MIRDSAIITRRGFGKLDGIIEENHDERGLDVKFNTFWGGKALLFSFPFENWKKGRKAIRVQIVILFILMLKKIYLLQLL